MFSIGDEVEILDIRPPSLRELVVGKIGRIISRRTSDTYIVRIGGVDSAYVFNESQLRATSQQNRVITFMSAHLSCNGLRVATFTSMREVHDWLAKNAWMGTRGLFLDGSTVYIDSASASAVPVMEVVMCEGTAVPQGPVSPIIENIIPRYELDEYGEEYDDDYAEE